MFAFAFTRAIASLSRDACCACSMLRFAVTRVLASLSRDAWRACCAAAEVRNDALEAAAPIASVAAATEALGAAAYCDSL